MQGTIKNIMKRIFLLKRSRYNFDGSETTQRFNQLVLTDQFTLLQKNLRNFSSREFGSFLRIIFRQTDIAMDRYLWGQEDDPSCECGGVLTIIHRWFYCPRYQQASDDFKQFIGPLWSRFTHPIDILAVAKDKMEMSNVIKETLKFAKRFDILKGKFYFK